MRSLAFAALLAVGCARAEAAPAADVPVLVELFTSEGCSSCPPADAVLADLERMKGVIVLAHHVDYWDGLGWKDPFSSSSSTARQRAYAAAIGGGTYTPEAVVDGRVQILGSRRSALETAIADAARNAHTSIVVTAARAGEDVDLTLRVGVLPDGAREDAELVVATVQPAARVTVPRGENAGRTLDHVAIARDLSVIGAVPRGGLATTARLKTREQRAVVWVQEKKSRRVLGTASILLSSPTP